MSSSGEQRKLAAIMFTDMAVYSAISQRDDKEQIKNRYINPSAFAAIYLGRGENQKALDWLDKCYENRESACWLLKVDPIYDSVRNEPRFRVLLKKVGLDQ